MSWNHEPVDKGGEYWIQDNYRTWGHASTAYLVETLRETEAALLLDWPGTHIAEGLYDDAHSIKWVLARRWFRPTPLTHPVADDHRADEQITALLLDRVARDNGNRTDLDTLTAELGIETEEQT